MDKQTKEYISKLKELQDEALKLCEKDKAEGKDRETLIYDNGRYHGLKLALESVQKITRDLEKRGYYNRGQEGGR